MGDTMVALTNSIEDQFRITLRGVRGGYPVPGPSTIRYGGNTTCVEVRVGGHLIIVDAGTGIISLGKFMMSEREKKNEPLRCIILMTHLHHDHTQGFPFFSPIFNPEAVLYIFGMKPGRGKTLEKEMHQLVQPPVSPLRLQLLRSERHFEHIVGGDIIVLNGKNEAPVVVKTRKNGIKLQKDAVVINTLFCKNHPLDGVLVYRINYKGRSAVIGTDTEGFIGGDREMIKFAMGADFMSHDAEYDEREYGDERQVRQGWGHSTWRMAIEVAQSAAVKQLALFHHNAGHDDAFLDEMERKAQSIFPNAFIAREGMTIVL